MFLGPIGLLTGGWTQGISPAWALDVDLGTVFKQQTLESCGMVRGVVVPGLVGTIPSLC